VINRYQTNQIILSISLTGLCLNLFGVSIFHNNWFKVWAFTTNLIFLNYLVNCVHQSSHFLLSKKTIWNRVLGHVASIFSGFTWSHFLTTHLEHHKHVGNDNLDPDYPIANSGNFFLIPFLIWRMDWLFFSFNLHSKKTYLADYIFDRMVQLLFVAIVIRLGYWDNFAYFWIIPMFVVGFLYGQYLFYWPHYSNQFEIWCRRQRWFLPQLYAGTIELARIFHAMHHDKVTNNTAYFPLETYLYLKLKNNWSEFSRGVDTQKYIMHKVS
jgi:beta-carotene hydroxylase